jgi:hypothetical protein
MQFQSMLIYKFLLALIALRLLYLKFMLLAHVLFHPFVRAESLLAHDAFNLRFFLPPPRTFITGNVPGSYKRDVDALGIGA